MKNLLMVCEAKLALEKSDAAAPSGKIEARVTTWGPREGADGRKFFYTPEGFMAWAKEFAASGRPLPMFVNHAADAIPCGEWCEFVFDDEGMTAYGRIYTNTTAGADLYRVMTESPSMFGGVSVGAYADEYQWVKEDGQPMAIGSDDPYENGYFQITKGGLREVSVVMYPNNPKAEVAKLECFTPDGAIDLRALEQHLRDSGVSKQNAVAAASVFKELIEQRDSVNRLNGNAPDRRDSDAEATEAAELLAALERRELVQVLTQRIKG